MLSTPYPDLKCAVEKKVVKQRFMLWKSCSNGRNLKLYSWSIQPTRSTLWTDKFFYTTSTSPVHQLQHLSKIVIEHQHDFSSLVVRSSKKKKEEVEEDLYFQTLRQPSPKPRIHVSQLGTNTRWYMYAVCTHTEVVSDPFRTKTKTANNTRPYTRRDDRRWKTPKQYQFRV